MHRTHTQCRAAVGGHMSTKGRGGSDRAVSRGVRDEPEPMSRKMKGRNGHLDPVLGSLAKPSHVMSGYSSTLGKALFSSE